MTADLTIRRPDGGDQVLFAHAELADKDGRGRLALGFAHRLAMLRLAFGKPMRLTSACRSAAYNRAIGGAKASFHIWDAPAYRAVDGCCAVDVATPDALYAAELVRLALNEGWSVGVNGPQRFVHLDRGADYLGARPGQMVFGY